MATKKRAPRSSTGERISLPARRDGAALRPDLLAAAQRAEGAAEAAGDLDEGAWARAAAAFEAAAMARFTHPIDQLGPDLEVFEHEDYCARCLRAGMVTTHEKRRERLSELAPLPVEIDRMAAWLERIVWTLRANGGSLPRRDERERLEKMLAAYDPDAWQHKFPGRVVVLCEQLAHERSQQSSWRTQVEREQDLGNAAVRLAEFVASETPPS